MSLRNLPLIDADEVAALLPPRDAVATIEAALHAGLDPAADPARTAVTASGGQVLLMPSEAGGSAGVKIVTVAPGNPARGLPRIQGLYLLLDAATLTPVALLDGTALTTVRTPAVSVAAVRTALLRDDGPLRLAVFGAGPQGVGHVRTLLDVVTPRRPVASVTYLVRRPDAVAVPARQDLPVRVVAAAGPEVGQVLADADVVVCATTAREPLVESAMIRDGAVVIAVGSHEPDAREVAGSLVARAQVVVEDVATAMREAGDVVQAVAEGRLRPEDLVALREVVTGRVMLAADRPVLFKSTGMAWEDLVVAAAVHERRQAVDV